MRFKEFLEAWTGYNEDIVAGDLVKSKSPGSKGLTGKVIWIKGDNVLVDFDGKRLTVPLNHLSLVTPKDHEMVQ